MKYATNYYKTNKDTRNTILKRFSMFDGVGLDAYPWDIEYCYFE